MLFFTGICALVPCNATRVGESFAATVTSVRLFALVPFKVTESSKHFSAFVTFVGLLAGMDAHVHC